MTITREHASIIVLIQSDYRSALITPSSRRMEFLPRNLPNSYLGIPPIPTQKIKKSSEESNETSEESKNKSEEFSISQVANVLFLKKVHSWGVVTEMVLGLFLLVLGVYSSVSFAPAGVHDLWSSLLRRYTKIGLCWELGGMGSEF